MDLRSLNTFVQVAEVNSFTKAAEILGYSQPTVSFQIKQLEKELEVQLFERIGHGIFLTKQGETVLRYAQKICKLSREMEVGVTEEQEPQGELRLAMSDSLCIALLMKGFVDFQTLYPKISVTIKTAGTGDLFRMLDHNEVDLVCTLDNHLYSTNYVIANEEAIQVHFVCAPSHPLEQKERVTIEELIQFPLFLTEKGMSYRRILDEMLAEKSMEIQPVLEIGSPDLICRLIEQNHGISFLPDFVTKEMVKEGRLKELVVEGFQVEVWKQLLYHKDKWLSPQMQATLDFLAGISLSG